MLVMIAVIFISTALLLYSLSVWSEQIRKGIKRWMVWTFASAFACDLAGTSIMFYCAADKFQLSWHSTWGYAALLFMGLHLAWALIALKYHGPSERYFHRFSLVAWSVWLFAFVSGIPMA